MIYIFNNKRFITRGINENISPLLQVFMWKCIENMPLSKDYLQVFKLVKEGKNLKITHSQEQPPYKKEYLIETDAPFYVGKIFVIDDESHAPMLPAE